MVCGHDIYGSFTSDFGLSVCRSRQRPNGRRNRPGEVGRLSLPCGRYAKAGTGGFSDDAEASGSADDETDNANSEDTEGVDIEASSRFIPLMLLR